MSRSHASVPRRRDWAAVARDYAAGVLTIDEICALHGVAVGVLYRQAAQDGWVKRRNPGRGPGGNAATPSIHKRLLLALDKKMAEFEKRMAQGGDSTAAESERDARTLNTLARLFEKLKGRSSDRAAVKAAVAAAPAATPAVSYVHDTDRLRHDLAQRLEKLRRDVDG